MIDDLAGIHAALSLGIGLDASWDLQVAQKGIPVLQFDHTTDCSPTDHPFFAFRKLKVVAAAASHGETTLGAIVRELKGKPFLLKMDIEGEEWTILDEIEPHVLEKCSQLVIEFHSLSKVANDAWYEQAHRVISQLTNSFAVVHLHGNNLSSRILSKSLCLPDSLEVSFVNRRDFSLEPTDEQFPGPLDRKNNPFYPDFDLGSFHFGE